MRPMEHSPPELPGASVVPPRGAGNFDGSRRRALREAGSNISQAAELLRIPRSTLRSKMLKYGIAGI